MIPRSFTGWIVLIVLVVLFVRNPAAFGHAITTGINAISTFASSIGH